MSMDVWISPHHCNFKNESKYIGFFQSVLLSVCMNGGVTLFSCLMVPLWGQGGLWLHLSSPWNILLPILQPVPRKELLVWFVSLTNDGRALLNISLSLSLLVKPASTEHTYLVISDSCVKVPALCCTAALVVAVSSNLPDLGVSFQEHHCGLRLNSSS